MALLTPAMSNDIYDEKQAPHFSSSSCWYKIYSNIRTAQSTGTQFDSHTCFTVTCRERKFQSQMGSQGSHTHPGPPRCYKSLYVKAQNAWHFLVTAHITRAASFDRTDFHISIIKFSILQAQNESINGRRFGGAILARTGH